MKTGLETPRRGPALEDDLVELAVELPRREAREHVVLRGRRALLDGGDALERLAKANRYRDTDVQSCFSTFHFFRKIIFPAQIFALFLLS